MTKHPSEFDTLEPVGAGSSQPSQPSSNVNCSAWSTNLDGNPYYPVHFDGNGSCENPITANYGTTDADYLDDDDDSNSHCGAPSLQSRKTNQPHLDICDFTDPKTKQ